MTQIISLIVGLMIIVSIFSALFAGLHLQARRMKTVSIFITISFVVVLVSQFLLVYNVVKN